MDLALPPSERSPGCFSELSGHWKASLRTPGCFFSFDLAGKAEAKGDNILLCSQLSILYFFADHLTSELCLSGTSRSGRRRKS